VRAYREVSAAAIFIISDLATKDFEWNPQFHSDIVKKGLKKTVKICLETFTS
jgi:hypothetical protein